MKREILLIENDARILELLTRFLERRGYAVQSAASLDAADRELRLHRPDLVVSDLLVGEEHAADRLERWARADRLPPTLVVSGCLDDEVERRLAAVPEVVGTLPKPFRFEELEARLEAALEGGLAGAPAAAPGPPGAPRATGAGAT